MKLTYREYLRHCKKVPPRIYYTWPYHQIAYPLSYVLFLLGFSANAVSFLAILVSAIGAYYIFQMNLLAGLLVFFVSYLLDCSDGNIARVRYGRLGEVAGDKQKLGLLLENLYTNASFFLFFISLGHYFAVVEGNLGFLWLAITAAGVKMISRYATLHVNVLRSSRQEDGKEERVDQLFTLGFMNEIKFFFARVVNSARLYYLAFLLVFLLWPQVLVGFFVWYFSLIVFLSFVKLFLVFIRRQP